MATQYSRRDFLRLCLGRSTSPQLHPNVAKLLKQRAFWANELDDAWMDDTDPYIEVCIGEISDIDDSILDHFGYDRYGLKSNTDCDGLPF